jgi:hypothetical protein
VSRKFQITKRVFFVLSVLLFLAIPVASLIWMALFWDGHCFFGESCPWWLFIVIIMAEVSKYIIPFFVATSLVWIVMSVFQSLSGDSRKSKWIQAALLVLVLLPIPVLSNNMINGFKVKYRVYIENKTSQILYLTAITTDHGSPKVISKRDIPIRAQSSADLVFDKTDTPLAGIAVCRTEDDCRLLPHDSDSPFYKINSYESLERLNPSWLAAIRSSPMYNNSNFIIMALSLVPILLLSGWLYLNPRQ